MAQSPRLSRLLRRAPFFLIRLVIATVVVATFFVYTQDFQIFPGIVGPYFAGHPLPEKAPSDVEELTARTTDGESIEVWHLKAQLEHAPVAILLHGNADTLRGYYNLQKWFQSMGIATYSFHYRGFGASTGFPSEQGIYRDGEAVVELVKNRESSPSENITIFGQSIGTGPAAYLAQHFQVKNLILISPYRSLTELVSGMFLYGYLTPFLKYTFPTGEYLKKLPNTCVVIAHGKKDSVIPFQHSVEMTSESAYKDHLAFITSDDAGHNDILGYTLKEVTQAIAGCLKHPEARPA